MRLAGIGCSNGLLKCQKILTRANDEPVVRERDDIGLTATRKTKTNGHSARVAGGVVGDEGVLRCVREANSDRDRAALEVSCLGETGRFFGWRERSLAYDTFGVRSSKSWIGSVHLNHGLEDLLGETFIVRAMGHARPERSCSQQSDTRDPLRR